MTQLLDRSNVSPSHSSQRRTAASSVAARKFRPDIEGLRAFAVLAVVAYHADLGVRGGFVGVDVFFVISGFLITRQLLASVGTRGIRALPDFYNRRIKRLLPASAAVVIVTVLAARIWAPALQVRSTAIDGMFTSFYGLNYRLAIEGTQYLHQNDAVSPLQHFWSLAVEEQFYVIWPILIILASWIGRRHRRGLLCILLSALAIVSFYYSVTVTRQLDSWAYFSLHTRAWELALGGLVALGADRLARMPRTLAEILGGVALLAVISSAFLYSDSTPYPGSAAALPVVGAALLIAAGCGPRRRVERILGEPGLQCVGRVSYAWYLWHWPMLIITPMIVGHPLDWPARLCVVWLSLLVAIGSYFAIENPLRHRGKRTWHGFATGFALSGAVILAATLVVTNLPSFVGSGRAVTVVQADAASTGVLHQMDQVLAAGVRTTKAPSNLTPRPDKAAKDLPAADGTNCHAEFTTIKQGPCVYGDPAGTHTAVLVGDSHADVWLGAFASAGRAEHWKIIDWTKSSCPAAKITVFNQSLNRTYTECDTWRQQVISRIATLKPNLVFLSDSENVVGADVSPQTWSSATLATMNAIKNSSGAKVELLQDVPVPAYDMPGCVAQHLSDVGACTFPVKKAYSFPSRHQELAKDAAAAGFPVVDPLRWICTADTCPAVVGNMLVYRDDTHLTATFSTWLAPRVSPLLTSG